MSCVIKEVDENEFDMEAFERQLGLALIKEYQGDPQKLLVTVLDFIKRKTNFFKHGDAKKRFLDAFRTVTGEAEAGIKAGFLAGGSAGSTATAAVEQVSLQDQPHTSQSAPVQAAEQGPESAAAAAAEPGEAAAATSGPPSPDVAPKEVQEDEEDKPDQKRKGLKPNAGRGADLEHYSWTQTLGEVTVIIPVPPGTKGRSLDVVIKKQHLRVAVKGQAPILDGKLAEAVKAEDCLWNLADGCVELNLTKAEGMHWWSCVVEGEPGIDTQQVEPENSKLQELDPETRSTVEKMMFDQRQKALGRPTSDEMQKQEMLKKFMAAHPEMDFSNAKIQM